MENVVLSFKCNRRYCHENHIQIRQCALSLGTWIITQGGPIFDHLMQVHPGHETSFLEGAKFRPFSNYGLSPSLLIKHDTFYEEQPLNVAYVFRDEKLRSILHKIMGDSVAGITLQTGDLHTGDVNQKILALSHYIYLYNENGKSIRPSENLFVKNLRFGQQIVAICTPFSAISLHNSWSQGSICNIISEYIALTDLKVTVGSEGAPVFTLKDGKLGPLTGLILSNLTYRNGSLTGLNIMALPTSFINRSYPIFPSYTPHIPYTPSNIQELEGQQSAIQIYTPKGWGSGTVITKDGLIICCAHIVNYGRESEIFVGIRNKLVTAKVIFSTPYGHTTELAVLEITDAYSQFSHLIPVRFRSKEVTEGEEVYSIGFCLFEKLLYPTVTRGLVSKLTKHCIMTSCFSNTGASGGPLLDRDGELLGIIISNLRTHKFIYPSYTVNTAVYSFRTSIENFMLSRDVQVLKDWSTSVPTDAAVINFGKTVNKL